MAAVAHDILKPNMLLVLVPLHWTRLLKRRYNQSALLAKSVAKHLDLVWYPDAHNDLSEPKHWAEWGIPKDLRICGVL
jgi:predicted amidophosphoribosyltransferase